MCRIMQPRPPSLFTSLPNSFLDSLRSPSNEHKQVSSKWLLGQTSYLTSKTFSKRAFKVFSLLPSCRISVGKSKKMLKIILNKQLSPFFTRITHYVLHILYYVLGEPNSARSAVFLNIVQKAFDPPPLRFEHHVANFF